MTRQQSHPGRHSQHCKVFMAQVWIIMKSCMIGYLVQALITVDVIAAMQWVQGYYDTLCPNTSTLQLLLQHAKLLRLKGFSCPF